MLEATLNFQAPALAARKSFSRQAATFARNIRARMTSGEVNPIFARRPAWPHTFMERSHGRRRSTFFEEEPPPSNFAREPT
jgi:hypothetical protein